MILKINDKNNKNNDDGHVIYIDKLTDHHIQNEKNKDNSNRKKKNPKKNK